MKAGKAALFLLKFGGELMFGLKKFVYTFLIGGRLYLKYS